MPEARRDVFQAIADPTRRAILTLLAAGALTPNALAARFDTSRQSISKHLSLLSECGLLRAEQSGREVYYTLQSKKLKEIERWMEPFRKLWEGRFSQLDELLKQTKKK